MGILISNERNAKQPVRSEENKKVNRGGVSASHPGQELRGGRGQHKNNSQQGFRLGTLKSRISRLAGMPQ